MSDQVTLYTAFGVQTTLAYTAQRLGAKGQWVTLLNCRDWHDACDAADKAYTTGVAKRVRVIDNAARKVIAGYGAAR